MAEESKKRGLGGTQMLRSGEKTRKDPKEKLRPDSDSHEVSVAIEVKVFVYEKLFRASGGLCP